MIHGRGRAFGVMPLLVGLLIASCTAAAAQSIGPGDWQFRELDALARAGLIDGRPQMPLLEWSETLTRFEAASLTLRAVEGMGAAYRGQGEALHEAARAEPGAAPAAPLAAVGREDLARVEKLIAEFRAELVTMGARVDDIEAALAQAHARLAEVEAEQRAHTLDGYVQLRYQDDNTRGANNQFMLRRARVNLRGPVSERISYRVEFQLDGEEDGNGCGGEVQLRSAYADYRLEWGVLRVGQARIPWGYELLESEAELWASERAFFMDRLFPDQRDIGVQWSYRRASSAPQLDLGVFNGAGINANDTNDRKDVAARVDVPVRNGSVALSAYLGEAGEDRGAIDRTRFGLGARFTWPEGTEFMGELVTGQDRGSDVRGWYAQLGRPTSTEPPNLLFVKYDRYDENTNVSGDLFRRWSIGYWWEPEPPARLGLVYEMRSPEEGFSELAEWDDTRAWVQLQVKY